MKIYFFLKHFEKYITKWMADHSIFLLRISIGIVYLWFGAVKFFPNLSPAEGLAIETISKITFNKMPDNVSINLLATWECLIGIGLITSLFKRITLALLFLQMIGTITPLFFFPGESFIKMPYAPTLEGQYIIKNLVIIAGAFVILSIIRGGAIIADPQIAKRAKEEEEIKLKTLNN